jgi:hypothetical protein
MPFPVASTGTCRGPEVRAYGRTLRTARSGGRQASRSGDEGLDVSSLGWGVRSNLRDKPAISRFTISALVVSPVADKSRWSSV